MPEYRSFDSYYDERARGFGAHVTSTSEENLLYFSKNKWGGMDMAFHEVSYQHMWPGGQVARCTEGYRTTRNISGRCLTTST